jgi:alpha-L-rhamnosidase
MWTSDVKVEQPDTYAGFRCKFSVNNDTIVEFRLLGASWYVVWIDGNYIYEISCGIS